jgi:pimeloyl-ACP methyl ester carboxylesterase
MTSTTNTSAGNARTTTTSSTTTSLASGDAPGVFVRTRHGEVHVVVDGDPSWPAVATLHGLPGGARDFRVLGGLLAARGVCTVRIDAPGFGRTPQFQTPPRTPAERAAVVVDVMRARGHARFGVVAHSFGGSAALACAALWPDVVTTLAMVCAMGVTRHRGLQLPHELTGALGALVKAPVVGPRALSLVQAAYERAGVRREKPVDAAGLYDETQVIGSIDFADLRAFAARVTCPTLVVGADDDPLVQRAVGFALVQALRHAPLVSHRRLQTGGHFLQRHDASAVAVWLADRLTTASSST